MTDNTKDMENTSMYLQFIEKLVTLSDSLRVKPSTVAGLHLVPIADVYFAMVLFSNGSEPLRVGRYDNYMDARDAMGEMTARLNKEITILREMAMSLLNVHVS